MKCMRMSLNVFKKHEILILELQKKKKKKFITLTPKFLTIEHILYQNHRIYNLGWPNQIHTQFHVLSLANDNL